MTRWIALAALFSARLLIGLQFQSIGSAGQPLMSEFGLSSSQLGALIGLYVLPGIIVALPGGITLPRLGDRGVAIMALAVMALGSLLVGLADGYGLLVAGRLLGGLGFGLLTVVLAKMTADWFVGRELTTAMGLLLASWPAGVALGLWTQPLAVEVAGWRCMMYETAGLCLAATLVIAAVARWSIARQPCMQRATLRCPLSRREAGTAALAGLSWGGLNLGTLIFFSFTPRLLAAAGLTAVTASSSVGWAMAISALAVPLGGLLAERIAAPVTAAAITCSAAAFALALLPLQWALWLLLPAIGFAVGLPAAVIIALPVRVMGPHARAAGLGVFYAVFFIEAAVGPLLGGWMEAKRASIWPAIELGSLALLVSGTVLFWLARRIAWRQVASHIAPPHARISWAQPVNRSLPVRR